MENIPFLVMAFAVTKSLIFLVVDLTESAFGFSTGFLSCAEAALKRPVNNMMRKMRVMIFNLSVENFVVAGLILWIKEIVDLIGHIF